MSLGPLLAVSQTFSGTNRKKCRYRITKQSQLSKFAEQAQSTAASPETTRPSRFWARIKAMFLWGRSEKTPRPALEQTELGLAQVRVVRNDMGDSGLDLALDGSSKGLPELKTQNAKDLLFEISGEEWTPPVKE